MKRIRVEKSKNFTTINNEFIFNKNLSLKAKGLLCHLLALPNDWKLYVKKLKNGVQMACLLSTQRLRNLHLMAI